MYQELKIKEIKEQLQQFEVKVSNGVATDAEVEKYRELMEKDAFYSSDAGKKLLEIGEAMEKLDRSLNHLGVEITRTSKGVNALNIIERELPGLMKK